MKKIIASRVVGVLAYLTYNQFFRYEFYEGTWVSNEAVTLESMAKVKRMSKKFCDALSRNFFGKMVINVEGGEMEYCSTDHPNDVTTKTVVLG